MTEMKEVFISYHEKSAGEYVTKLANRLEGAGISCWYAKRDLPSGGDFADHIPPQLYGCKVFLLILNEGANHSRHVENEVGLAFRRYNKGEKITILPYQVEKCDFAHWLDYYLIHIQIQSAEVMDDNALVLEVAHKLGREPAKNGWCGSNTRWILKNGLLTISPFLRQRGEIANFYHQDIPLCVNTPWWSDYESISSVAIGNYITRIGARAFNHCVNLTDVTIPNSVTEIGDYAFSDCANLSNIIIPDSVISIGMWAFSGCINLNSVNISNNITSIDIRVFDGCTNLTNIIIPNSVTQIRAYAFCGTNLYSVTIPDSVEKLGECAFYACENLHDVIISDSIISIENSTFKGCSNLTGVNIPNSVTNIRHSAFQGCSNLTNANIPDSITYIGYDAFMDCPNLKSVSIPANAEIDDRAFDPHTEVIRRPVR